MKKIILFISITLLLVSCEQNKYKYEMNTPGMLVNKETGVVYVMESGDKAIRYDFVKEEMTTIRLREK